MGRYIKNAELKTGGYSIRAPYAPAAVGPTTPVDGLLRFNSSINKMQYYTNNAWRNFSAEGRVELYKDSFMGNGNDRTFGPMTLSYTAGEEIYLLVYIGNVFQNPGVAYTVFNDTITFTSTPADQQPIIILHGYGSTSVAV
jgi:hypothetical protein